MLRVCGLRELRRTYSEAEGRGWGGLSSHAVLRLVEEAAGLELRSPIFEALDPSGAVAASTTTSLADGYAYVLEGLASGAYTVIGFVDRELILGKAESVAFSLDYDHYFQPRLDRFFTALP